MTTATARRLTQPTGGYPPRPELLPAGVFEHGRYRVRFARRAGELDSVLRLRYQVFNLEMGEGLAASAATGRDEDAFDAACHHLVVEDAAGAVIGTYRMQTAAMAAGGLGFYSAGEFDLSALPAEVIARAIEVGRACIAREHRNRQVLFLLWKGLARYLAATGTRYLFGCCSLTSQDPAEGLRALAHFAARGLLHPRFTVAPRPGLECAGDAAAAAAAVAADPAAVELPPLFRTYLRYGALVCGPPAIDYEFKTIDFLVLLDSAGLDPRSRALFFD
jgi:putative hemolysin